MSTFFRAGEHGSYKRTKGQDSAQFTGTQEADIIEDILGDELDDYCIFVSGSTPEAIAAKVEETEREFAKNPRLAKAFLAVMCVCCVGHRNVLKKYMNDKAPRVLADYLEEHFTINRVVNFTALSMGGHCILAAGGSTKATFIMVARKRLGGNHIWDADYTKGNSSEKQREIYDKRKVYTKYPEAYKSGVRILTVLHKYSGIAPGKEISPREGDVPPSKGVIISEPGGSKPNEPIQIPDTGDDTDPNKSKEASSAADQIMEVDMSWAAASEGDTGKGKRKADDQGVFNAEELWEEFKKTKIPPLPEEAATTYLLRLSKQIFDDDAAGEVNINYGNQIVAAAMLCGQSPENFIPPKLKARMIAAQAALDEKAREDDASAGTKE